MADTSLIYLAVGCEGVNGLKSVSSEDALRKRAPKRQGAKIVVT
jgi:hypothetical protein